MCDPSLGCRTSPGLNRGAAVADTIRRGAGELALALLLLALVWGACAAVVVTAARVCGTGGRQGQASEPTPASRSLPPRQRALTEPRGHDHLPGPVEDDLPESQLEAGGARGGVSAAISPWRKR